MGNLGIGIGIATGVGFNSRDRINQIILTFDSIANVPVASAESLSDWNTFFSLPTNGESFTKASVVGDIVTLEGGRGISIDNYKFRNDGHLVEIHDSGCIETLGVDCFKGASKLERVFMQGVTTHLSTINDYGAFGVCSVLEYINLPNLINAGSCICYNCVSLNEVHFDSVKELGRFSLYYCSSLKNVVLPNLEVFSGDMFNITPIERLEIPKVTAETATWYPENALRFSSTGRVDIICDPSILTCCNGTPHWSLYQALSNYSVYVNGSLYDPFITRSTGDLEITFDSLVGITTAFGGLLTDSNSVASWNSAFRHREWSTPFTSIEWIGNKVILKGGENIRYSTASTWNEWQQLHIIKLEDHGCVTCLSTYGVYYTLNDWSLPNLKVLDNYALGDMTATNSIFFENLIAAYTSSFLGAKYSEFYFPKLRYQGLLLFRLCPNISKIYTPLLEAIGRHPSDNTAYIDLAGDTIDLTIPISFMTSNSGQPHASVAKLITDNTITLHTYPSPLEMTLTSNGDGSGVARLAFEVSSDTTIEVDGDALFYDDVSGTINPSLTRTIVAGAMRYFYVKVVQGVSTFTINNPDRIIKWGYPDYSNRWVGYIDGFMSASVNTPILGGALDSLLNVTHFSLYNSGVSNLTVNYNFATMSRTLVEFDLTSLGLGHGNPDTIPRTMKYIYTYCDRDSAGDFHNLPSDIEYVYYMGYLGTTNPTTVGSFLRLPNEIISLSLNGTENISGDFADVNSNIRGLILGSIADTCGGDFADLPSDIVQMSYYGIGNISYTQGKVWNGPLAYVKLKPSGLDGLTLQEQSDLITDMSIADWDDRGSCYFYIRGDNTVSMADTNQGGIWGDFSGTATPSALAISLKLLKTKVETILLQTAVTPSETGDGTGFPTGFGNWWRS